MINFRNATFHKLVADKSGFPADRKPQIVFAGKSNVGKSSLINLLTGQKKLARVSSQPGKTRQVIYYEIDGKLYFVDLPGYGFARAGKGEIAQFSSLTDDYLTSGQPIALVIHLMDGRHEPSEGDLQMIDWLEHSGLPHMFILTKSDKVKPNQRQRHVNMIRKALPEDIAPEFHPLWTSTVKREGIQRLRTEIGMVLGEQVKATD